MKTKIASVFLTGFILMSTSAFADVTGQDVVSPLPWAIKQAYSNWCWCTSAKVLGRTSHTVCSYYKAGKNTSTCPNTTGNLYNIEEAVEDLSATSGELVEGKLSWSTIKSETSADDPWLISTGSHAMVGMGWETRTNPTYSLVIVMDPGYGNYVYYDYNVMTWQDTMKTNGYY